MTAPRLSYYLKVKSVSILQLTEIFAYSFIAQADKAGVL